MEPQRGAGGGPFTVGVNLTWLVPGVVGGSEEYTMRLLRSVGPELPDGVRLRLYARPELLDVHGDIVGCHPVVLTPRIGSRAKRVGLEHSWLAHHSRNDDVVHHTGGTVPYVRTTPAIVTVHDPQPLDLPENFHPIKRWWLNTTLPYSVRAARLVLCPSRFTADRLRSLLGVPDDKLRVVIHGHRGDAGSPDREGDEGIGGASGPRSGSERTTRFGRYLLYPAIAYPHKRHVDLVRALDRLGPELGDVSVVFTGRPGPELAAVHAEADRLGVGDRVHSLGRVPAAELELLYRSAQAMVFPSAYEGFGNPALEAMSAGCPALVSTAGALPEVVGDAAMVFPIGDVAAIADGIGKLLSDPVLADDLRRRGRARARCFDPGIAAGALARVYGELADSRKS